MRSLKLIILLTFVAFKCLQAQAPHLFKYQGVARNLDGTPITDQNVGLRLTIFESSINGNAVFLETHLTSTNDMGLFHVNIGQGLALIGQLSNLDWGSNPHFIQVEMDADGGTNYKLMGQSQLLSVPYALYSASDPSSENELQSLSINNDTLSISSGNSIVIGNNGSLWSEKGSDLFFNGGNIGIGTKNPIRRLHLMDTLTDQNATSSRFDIKGGSTSKYIYRGMDLRMSGMNGSNRAFQSWSKGSSAGKNVGVAGYADSALINIAVRGYSSAENTNNQGFNMGLKGNAFGSGYSNIACGAYATTGNTPNGYSYGVVAKATSATGANNYGIYAEAANAANNYAAFINGDATLTGILTQASDQKLKKNIEEVNSTLNIINALRVVKYDYRVIEGLQLPEGQHYGFIAQELKAILPGLVKENKLKPSTMDTDDQWKNEPSFLSINYTEVIPLLVKAIQEQQKIIEQIVKETAITKKL